MPRSPTIARRPRESAAPVWTLLALFLFLIFTSAFSSKQSLTSGAFLTNSFQGACLSGPCNRNAGRKRVRQSFTSDRRAGTWPIAVRTVTQHCRRIIGSLRKIHKAVFCPRPARSSQRRERELTPTQHWNLVVINNLFITGQVDDFCSQEHGHDPGNSGDDFERFQDRTLCNVKSKLGWERCGASHPRGSSKLQMGQVFSCWKVCCFNQSKLSDSSLLRDNEKWLY